jgi:hypothetical protein
MNEKHIAELNAALQEFRGGKAFFNVYRDHTSRQFTLGVVASAPAAEPAGISFFNCEFLSGPTEWNDIQLEARLATCTDRTPGFEVVDTRAGFVIRGSECITLGHTNRTISINK